MTVCIVRGVAHTDECTEWIYTHTAPQLPSAFMELYTDFQLIVFSHSRQLFSEKKLYKLTVHYLLKHTNTVGD